MTETRVTCDRCGKEVEQTELADLRLYSYFPCGETDFNPDSEPTVAYTYDLCHDCFRELLSTFFAEKVWAK